MSRKISEQVAALEDARDFYRDARDGLIDKVDTLKAEKVELQQLFDRVALTCDQRGETITELEFERDQLADRVDALRSQVGLVTRERDEWEANAESAMEALPRIVSSGELREGQTVAYSYRGEPWRAGVVRNDQSDGKGRWIAGEEGQFSDICDPIVLLEDVKNVGTTGLTLKENGESFTRAIKRRGEVIEPHELREGDVFDVWDARGKQSTNYRAELGPWEFKPGDQIRLIHRSETLVRSKRFSLVRDEDETGVSGIGTVAEGVIYSDGHVSMRWVVGEHRSTVSYDNIEAVEAVHGHGGKTRVVVDDE